MESDKIYVLCSQKKHVSHFFKKFFAEFKRIHRLRRGHDFSQSMATPLDTAAPDSQPMSSE